MGVACAVRIVRNVRGVAPVISFLQNMYLIGRFMASTVDDAPLHVDPGCAVESKLSNRKVTNRTNNERTEADDGFGSERENERDERPGGIRGTSYWT